MRLFVLALLLLPLAAHADVALTLPTSGGGIAGLLLVGCGFLLRHFAQPLFALLGSLVTKLTGKADAAIEGSAKGKSDPTDAQREAHAIDQLGVALSDALADVGASLSTLNTLDRATLLGVLSSTEKRFAAAVDTSSLEGALLALGNMLLGGVGGWAKGKLMALVHGHQVAAAIAAPAVVATEKRVITTADGTHVVAPVTAS